MNRITALVGWAIVALVITTPAYAVPMFFTTPDFPLPGSTGDGLVGAIYTGIDVDNLADARAHINTYSADSAFLARQVDYPQGSQDTVVVPGPPTTFNDLLGSDAASLSNPAVGNQGILNSIIQFTGYFSVERDNSAFPFSLGSDDGSALLIQGIEVIVNDGIHPFPGGGAGPQDVAFQNAGLYEMEILFFESQAVAYGIEFVLGDFAGNNQVVPQFLLHSTPVPLPGIISLMGIGLAALGLTMSRRRKEQGVCGRARSIIPAGENPAPAR